MTERLRIHPVLLTIAAVIVSGLASAFIAYASASSAINARVSVLESRQNEEEKRLERIEDKVDVLLQRSSRP